MKTHNFDLHRILIFSLLALSIVSCSKKKEEVTPTKTEETSIKAVKNVKQNDRSGSTAADGAMDDVNDFINNNITPQASTRLEAYNLPCGVVRVDTNTKNASGKTVYQMKYGDATPCGYSKKKSGTVSFQLIKGATFTEIGAAFKITYSDYVVEVLATNDIIKVNGYTVISNVNGGAIWNVVSDSTKTFKHKIRGNYTIMYANGEIRNRNTYQMRTWSSKNSWAGLTFSVDGDTTIAATQISEIGKTLDGNYDFQTQILEAYTWKNCETTFAGPYVLQIGKARMNVIVPTISPAHFEVEAGYHVAEDKTPTKLNNCNTNAYKITTTIDNTVITEYQLY